jgi:methionine aminopeptidase
MEGAEEATQADYDATFIDQPAILDKYKAAGVIADAALERAISLAIVDADISTICGNIDTFVEEELLKVFSNKKSKKMERGIAFPTCLSVNEIMGHYSPCADDS